MHGTVQGGFVMVFLQEILEGAMLASTRGRMRASAPYELHLK